MGREKIRDIQKKMTKKIPELGEWMEAVERGG